MKKSILSLGALALVSSLFFSCSKNKTKVLTQEEATKQIKSSIQSDVISADLELVFNNGWLFANGSISTMSYGCLAPCANVSLTFEGGVRTLVIDYGEDYCLCNDGLYRKGKVVATAQNFDLINSERALVTTGYFVKDSNGLEKSVNANLTATVTKELFSSETTFHTTESITVSTNNDDADFVRTSDFTRVHDRGLLINPFDDKFTTWGSARTEKQDGYVVDKNVSETNPLVYKISCLQFVSGVAQLNINGNEYAVDFGNGTCDLNATVSIGSNVWEIGL